MEVLAREKAELSARLAEARTTTADSAAAITALPLPDLAARDPRIARLLSENSRLEGEARNVSTELRQRLDELRAAREKLDGEGRRAVALAADLEVTGTWLAESRTEVLRLGARVTEMQKAVDDARELRSWSAQTEAALAESGRQKESLQAERDRLQARLAELDARPRVDPAEVERLRSQVAELRAASDAAGVRAEEMRARLATAQAEAGKAEALLAALSAAERSVGQLTRGREGL
jgi:chromosome segregation ATPase